MLLVVLAPEETAMVPNAVKVVSIALPPLVADKNPPELMIKLLAIAPETKKDPLWLVPLM